MTNQIDPAFLALPSAKLADAALARSRQLGAEHADFRLERIRNQQLQLHNSRVENLEDSDDSGIAVRVIVDGTWGFASSVDITPEAAVRTAEQAVAVARTSKAINAERIELAEEPVYPQATWVSAYEINPFQVAPADKIELFTEWSSRLLGAEGVDHVDISLQAVQENKFYADLAGTSTTQQRIRIHPMVTATALDATGGFETMRTLAPPVGRGWEYVVGDFYNWEQELSELPELLAAKLQAPSVKAGHYDLVIDPSNLWLTIHESVGHATELDRVLGYEAAYAGTSFATLEKLGSFRYGSEAMTITGDRTVAHGLSTIGYDDEGVAGQAWDLIRNGVLVGYQLDRRMAALKGLGRSNGCAFADSPSHIQLQRMPNVSLQPGAKDLSTNELIAGVEDGIYILGDKSWSIDMQRYNFQFTGQRFYQIKGGKLAGQLRDVAYQATTTDFWGSLEAVGGRQTYVLGGAFNCGKGQPGQVAAVSHGCPSTLFRGIRILNTTQETI